jgi:hypothetical protein
VFVIHPGQIGWYAGLLRGSIVGTPLAGAVQMYLPGAQSIVYLFSMVVFSFLWYLVIAFLAVKIVRALALAKSYEVQVLF